MLGIQLLKGIMCCVVAGREMCRGIQVSFGITHTCSNYNVQIKAPEVVQID